MEVLVAVLTPTLAFTTTLALTHILSRKLPERGWVDEDVHKPGRPRVARPGGPAILAGVTAGGLTLHLCTGSQEALAVILVTILAGLVGLADDAWVLSGPLKPALLTLASTPILLLHTYSSYLALPFFGSVRLTILYPMLVVLAVPVVANSFNSMDVLNGVVSGFTIIATLPVILALLLKARFEALLLAATLLAAALAFYTHHRYPSRIFPGDSGSLSLGASYTALVVVGGVEMVGVVAILPAALNSFLFLSSVRRLLEHRAVKTRPTTLLDDFRLSASRSPEAPVTLLRMILAEGPLSERELIRELFKLSTFSAILATLTAFTL